MVNPSSRYNLRERTISTGEPSPLKTYRKIALALSGNDENAYVVKFFDKKIKESRNGEDEIVVAAESQMLYLIMSMIVKPELENPSRRMK